MAIQPAILACFSRIHNTEASEWYCHNLVEAMAKLSILKERKRAEESLRKVQLVNPTLMTRTPTKYRGTHRIIQATVADCGKRFMGI